MSDLPGPLRPRFYHRSAKVVLEGVAIAAELGHKDLNWLGLTDETMSLMLKGW
jgi:hypothetical protein